MWCPYCPHSVVLYTRSPDETTVSTIAAQPPYSPSTRSPASISPPPPATKQALLLRPIIHIIRPFARLILLDQLRHYPSTALSASCHSNPPSRTRPRSSLSNSPRIIKLFEPIRKHVFLFILLQKGITFPQAVILVQHPLEELTKS
jgi:hypothetical protein